MTETSESAATDAATWLEELCGRCLRDEASDLHLVAGQPPYLRVEGTLAPIPEAPPCDKARLEALADHLFAGRERAGYERTGAQDGAFTSAGGARFRFNLFRASDAISIALRRLEDEFRGLAELGMPESLYELCELPDGLVVVAGPTGAGKSTTLATLLDRINGQRPGHIVTIEDPIEYVHRPRKCLVNQREVGRDAGSFNDALVSAMRQDPDIILVGEIRDRNTIRTAITAAETGHLVLTTVHASDCVGAIERLIAVFPADEQEGIRRLLAFTIKAIVAQHLLPCDGPRASSRRERTVVSEVLRVTPAVSNLIAQAKPAQIYSSMETGKASGMQTLEEDLARLWGEGRISEATAVNLARTPSTLRERARRYKHQPTVRITRRGGA